MVGQSGKNPTLSNAEIFRQYRLFEIEQEEVYLDDRQLDELWQLDRDNSSENIISETLTMYGFGGFAGQNLTVAAGDNYQLSIINYQLSPPLPVPPVP